MDKPLNRIGMLLMGTTMLAVALSAVFVLLSGTGMDCVTVYFHTLQERERLNEDRTMLYRRGEVRQNIFDRLVEGQLSLREAANSLSDEDDHYPERLRLPSFLHWRHLTQEERYMQMLLIQVGNKLQGGPRRDEVLKRLLSELRAYQDACPRSLSADPPSHLEATQPLPPHQPPPIRQPKPVAE